MVIYRHFYHSAYYRKGDSFTMTYHQWEGITIFVMNVKIDRLSWDVVSDPEIEEIYGLIDLIDRNDDDEVYN